jgi:hypothetical protein
MIIDKRLKSAAYYMGFAAFFTLFGVIHSPFENGQLFLPWTVESTTPFRFFFAYLLVAGLLLLMDRYHQKQTI